MWTPRRVLLLAAGFAFFLCTYGVYGYFLGGIDGLPPLPEEYWPSDTPTVLELPPQRENEAERKLRMAFGEDEKVRNCSIKLEIATRGLVMAAEQVQPERDGRLKLTPFHIAIFGKPRPGSGFVEINTVRSKEAYITFDPPIRSLMDMNRCKVVAGELVGEILIVNNRGTLPKDDDISVFTQGPLYYQEAIRRIWTKADVRLTDVQSKPEPIIITGTGLDLFLAADTKPEPASLAKKKPRSESISGVDRIRLWSDVNMNLWVDSRSGFLGTARDTQPAPAAAPKKDAEVKTAAKPAEPPERSKVVIVTQGPFAYDMVTDTATFDISQHPSPRPNDVEVTRINGVEGKREHLVCEHLRLQFRRKAGAQKTAEQPAAGLEIETALATGKQVTLTSDSENLDAFGSELTYDARTGVSVLKGSPEMVAAKDGHEIYAREMRLRMDGKGLQEVVAKGPGIIKMLDRAKGQRTKHARWKDELISSREGNTDLLVLKGEASFDDLDQNQKIEAELIKVWLEPDPRGKAPNRDKEKDAQPRPRQLEAVGKVRALSPDLRIHDTDRLAIWFKDVAPAGGQLPPALPPASPAPAAGPDAAPAAPAVAATTPPLPAPAAPPAAAPPAAPAKKARPPIDLSARSVEAHVLRTPVKNDLDRLWCEGAVHVHQEPANPEDKGVDIRGETLQLTHHADGDVLAVTGDLAHVQLDKLAILGPEVNIDQKTNKAWVQGIGAMRMPSNTDFDGKKLAKAADLIVHWNRSMYFDGRQAEFHGGVQAEQETAHLLCQTMRVTLDRLVSLREGEKGKQPAQVQTLLCDKSVQVEDVKQVDGRLAAYKRIDCRELVMDKDKEDSIVNAPGPGEVRILQPGNKDDGLNGAGAPAPPSPSGKPPEQEMKLTWVRYGGRMYANNQTRTAKFFDNVEVVHVPSEDPALAINVDRLPPRALYLSCQRLEVYTTRNLNGATTQEMRALQKVFVQSQEFWGRAHEVKFDEAKDQIIFEGGDGGLASLYRIKIQGGKPEEITGKKIFYWRKTGKFQVEGGRQINVTN